MNDTVRVPFALKAAERNLKKNTGNAYDQPISPQGP
jgi:hypothetical protein